MDPSTFQELAKGSFLFGFSITGLVASSIFSLIGFMYYKQSKHDTSYMKLLCGIVLIGFPMFIVSTAKIIIIGTILTLFPMILSFFRSI